MTTFQGEDTRNFVLTLNKPNVINIKCITKEELLPFFNKYYKSRNCNVSEISFHLFSLLAPCAQESTVL